MRKGQCHTRGISQSLEEGVEDRLQSGVKSAAEIHGFAEKETLEFRMISYK
jgi:hypothetical protein